MYPNCFELQIVTTFTKLSECAALCNLFETECSWKQTLIKDSLNMYLSKCISKCLGL